VVIDNLETVSDVDALMPSLARIGRPTRFLLTSRQSMSHFPYVTRLAVPPLSMAHSRLLIESELRRRGRGTMPTLEEMEALYEIVGGMPLALKLVAAQMNRWPISVLLENMRHARLAAPESLYTFIYRHTWQALHDNARNLLLSMMTVAPTGEDLDWLRLIGAQPLNEFDDALSQLLAYSMLEVAGPPDAPRYGLHRLTATFLQTEILTDWSEPSEEPPRV
jgi:hypothetical protein